MASDLGPADEVPVVSWRAPTSRVQLNLLLLGDTAFGANYQERAAARGRNNVLEEYGYDHGFEHLDQILQSVDLAVANLETPLTKRRSSPFEDIRPYIHYDDPELTLRHLLKHNINAVTLANNHTHDMGVPGLLDTIEALEQHGVLAIGAGRTLARAESPLRVYADIDGGEPFSASLFSRFRGGRLFREVLKAYATDDSAGSAPFPTAQTARSVARLRAQRPDEFIVVLPHWRRDYRWASDAQRKAAEQLIDAGASMIVGHGSHMAQEIDFLNGRLVLNGIGNFLFNSPGRYQKMGVPPYSLMARLTVVAESITVRLYPIHTDNRQTDYQSRPVAREQFEEFHRDARARTNEPKLFDAAVESAEDEHGHHLVLRLDRSGGLSRAIRRRAEPVRAFGLGGRKGRGERR